jgi:hypothetical protein
MNEQDLRDCFAMFAINGLIAKGDGEVLRPSSMSVRAYEYADAMLEARAPKEVGIKTVKRTRKTND